MPLSAVPHDGARVPREVPSTACPSRSRRTSPEPVFPMPRESGSASCRPAAQQHHRRTHRGGPAGSSSARPSCPDCDALLRRVEPARHQRAARRSAPAATGGFQLDRAAAVGYGAAPRRHQRRAGSACRGVSGLTTPLGRSRRVPRRALISGRAAGPMAPSLRVDPAMLSTSSAATDIRLDRPPGGRLDLDDLTVGGEPSVRACGSGCALDAGYGLPLDPAIRVGGRRRPLRSSRAQTSARVEKVASVEVPHAQAAASSSTVLEVR